MNNENTAHNFVYGKNGTGSNMTSRAGTLYSYGSILAIKKYDYIFVSEIISNYSSTSQRHALHLNRAIGWNTPQQDKSILIYDDIQAITHHIKEYRDKAVTVEIGIAIDKIKDMLLLQKRARTRNYFDAIERVINNAKKLINFAGIDKRTSQYKTFLQYSDIDNLKINYIDLINNYEKMKDKERKKEIERKHKRVLERITNKTGHDMKEYSKTELSKYDFLFVKEQTLCTTQSLCVDLKPAIILYKRLLSGKDIIGMKIDYYTILSHNETYVQIGCHNILLKELERVLGGLI